MKNSNTALGYHIIAYVIIAISMLMFLAITYALFAIFPREYYWIAGIIDVVLLGVGIMIMSNIPFVSSQVKPATFRHKPYNILVLSNSLSMLKSVAVTCHVYNFAVMNKSI